MAVTVKSNSAFIFDLDDTLYSEREFEISGINFVYNFLKVKHFTVQFLIENRKNWVNLLANSDEVSNSKDQILELYRNHIPNIGLYDDAFLFLKKLSLSNIEMSIITDGRSVTQRNKLKALSIDNLFKNIIISEEIKSEKPAELNYSLAVKNILSSQYIYIGDNLNKDFITPNRLGWMTICLLNRGNNVHPQNFNIPAEFLPKFTINSFNEIFLDAE